MVNPHKLPPLAVIAKEAGDVVAAMQDQIIAEKDYEIKDDDSPVTPADKAAHKIIMKRLKEQYPDIAVVSEESSEEDIAKAVQSNDRIDTDPLDNTGSYIDGWKGYSVNIGRITDGVPVEGVAYFPGVKELYYTQDGKAYFSKNDGPPKEIHVKKLPLRKPLQVACGFNERNASFLDERGMVHEQDYELRKHPGQYRSCMVASGQCDLTGLHGGMSDGFKSWDTAGPHAVLLAAGGDFVTETGAPMRYHHTTELPSHIAGGIDTLKALGLVQPELFKQSRIVGS